jgi:hypothetical protein
VAYKLESDLKHVLNRRAAEDSAAYIETAAMAARSMDDSDIVLVDSVDRALKVSGCFCEFGVFQGRTLTRIASLAPDRAVHGFDSFEGLPEDWRDGYKQGAFQTRVPAIGAKNVQLHAGWFDATVPSFVATLAQPVALAHIDCDLYSSTRTVLDSITPHLTVGSIILFDEYFNYPGWRHHEHRALQESIESGELTVDAISYNAHGEQVAFIVTGGTKIGTALHA